ncbi:outer membrane protein TolC [Chryseobacterium defluvii]|uniref:Outer membrane protein TolC n=1 Tax=Chryseobacterium defluvii TaxID=160396 RepID=A0A840KIP2_9FLAO|nr:TolC family protein [Chryseobacterium defluvii]MBB4807360.1 outer membrane protein TolC [Chryseobacterium defluvii]
MRICKYIFTCVLVVYISNLYGQSKIKCDLIEITNKAFDKNPTIKRSSYTIQDAEADLQVQKGTFDINLFSEISAKKDRYTLFNADPRNQFIDKVLKSNTVGLSAGLRKKLRSGQTTDISFNYGFNDNNFPFDAFNQPVGPFWGNHTTSVNLSLTQPLLKGRGRSITTTSERISSLYIENSKNNNEFTNSYEILQVGLAYWNYYTAFKSLEIYRQNEGRVRNVLDITKELVKADKKPAGDLAQVNADLANQEKLTTMAEQNLYEARINLGRAIGLNNEESQQLDIPLNEFPTIAESAYRDGLDKNAFIEVAKEKRGDVKAVEKISEALEMQYKLAENNKKPQLDLTGFVYYGSASAGNGIDKAFTAFTNNEGRNIGAGARLTFSFPVNNNWARGNYTKSEIALRDQKVSNDNLQRNIDLNISNAINNLNNRVIILEKAKEALNYYQEAFSNEQIKFQTGLTTILNLILFQERLTSSELEYLQAYQQFANAIIGFRHETGTLISQDNNGFTVDQKAFYTIPNTDNY